MSFNKKHLFIKFNNAKTIKPIIQSTIAVFSVDGGWIRELQYKALVFFFKKKVKIYSKVFLRLSLSVYNTKKSIGIRMGKGKGSSYQLYKCISPGQILFEINFTKKKEINNEKLKWLQNLIFLINQKSPLQLKLFIL